MEEAVNRYESHLHLLQERHPEIAARVAALTGQSWQLVVRSPNQELDLYKAPYFLHEQQVEGSIRYWLSEISLANVQGLIVYGIGLGHIWEYLKQWLHAAPFRRLTFLEDDPEIVHHLLFLERAKELLSDPQVTLLPLDEPLKQELLWKVAEKQLFQNVHLIALPSYILRKENKFKEIQFVYDYARYSLSVRFGEYFGAYKLFFENFWENLLHLPHSYLAGGLHSRFKGIPAIICGAGPSLAKNIHLLPEFKDKALIIAGGTAVGVLNGNGIDPHFTIGVDPFPSSFSRLLAYTSFEAPFAYKPRVLKKLFFSPIAPSGLS